MYFIALIDSYKMPNFVACSCLKTGLLIGTNGKLMNCPGCGPNSTQYGVSPVISNHGFTTKDGYNAAQRARARIECEPIIQRAIENYKSKNDGITEKQLKTYKKTQTARMMKALLENKYQLKD